MGTRLRIAGAALHIKPDFSSHVQQSAVRVSSWLSRMRRVFSIPIRRPRRPAMHFQLIYAAQAGTRSSSLVMSKLGRLVQPNMPRQSYFSFLWPAKVVHGSMIAGRDHQNLECATHPRLQHIASGYSPPTNYRPSHSTTCFVLSENHHFNTNPYVISSHCPTYGQAHPRLLLLLPAPLQKPQILLHRLNA